jgi:CHAT domain-containing protein
MAARQEQYSQLVIQLKLSDPEYASLTTVDPPALDEVQALLDADTTLLSFVVGTDFTLIYVVTRDQIVAREVPIGDAGLRAMVGEREFAQPRGAVDGLSQLASALLDPVRDNITTAKLGIIPHGVLHYVPFAALPYADRVLGDAFLLFSLPSASTLPFVESKRHRTEPGARLALSPDLKEGVSPLPFADQEARFVAQLFGTQPLLDTAASEAAVKRESGQIEVLHVASHGEYNPRNPLFSRVLLQPGEGEDGSLEVHEVYGLDLPRARLVVLSACETNLGEQSRGDEVVGLTRAFIYAGAPTVVSSLWTVNDRATSLFMGAFYEALQSGDAPAMATRQAQARVREEYSHPYYWASFVLTGAPD